VTCTIVRGEVLFGIFRLPEGKRRTQLEAAARKFLDGIPCEGLPQEAADMYAKLKSAQQRAGLPLDENDLWIAATAMALGATVVSRDSDFRRIEDLPVVEPRYQ
jgi:predicted nucleic acid-binding protein